MKLQSPGYLVTTLAILVACNAKQPPQVTGNIAERPNFLIIITDDMGFTDLGAFGGHDIETPTLDRLAMEGIRFTNFHGHLSCGPSRATLISGTGNHEAGLGTQIDYPTFRGQRNYDRYLVDRVATIPEVLRGGGYRTYLAGKWGIGGPPNIDPSERGFDKSFALLPSGGGHYEPLFHDSRYNLNGQPYAESASPIFSTTLFTNFLISFFEEDQDSDAPFFAWFAPTAPHWPLHFPPGMEEKYTGRYDEGYDVIRDQRVAGAVLEGILPAGADVDAFESQAKDWQSLSNEEKAIQTRIMEIYASMATHMDQEIERLLTHMEAVGALDNTLILFINDNGAQGGPIFGGPNSYSTGRTFNNELQNLGSGDSWVNMGEGWAEAITAPFRDGKASVYEGGVRVAAFAHWSDIGNTESLYRHYLNNMDVMPTLLELAGVAHPAPQFNGREVYPMRGKSFAAVLLGDTSPVYQDDEAIILSSAGRHFMQRGQWKLVKELKSEWELYDLAADPYEKTDLADHNPAIVKDMLVEFVAHARENNILDRN